MADTKTKLSALYEVKPITETIAERVNEMFNTHGEDVTAAALDEVTEIVKKVRKREGSETEAESERLVEADIAVNGDDAESAKLVYAALTLNGVEYVLTPHADGNGFHVSVDASAFPDREIQISLTSDHGFHVTSKAYLEA